MATLQNNQWLSAIFIFVYITSSTLIFQIVSAWPLERTSQYLGTQNQNGEHILLFKLPKSISSQIQGQIQHQQLSPSWLNQDQMQQEASLILEQPIRSLYGDRDLNEKSISLTVPLSELASSSRPQSRAGASELQYRPIHSERSKYVSSSDARLPHFPGSQVVFEYLATDESNSNEIKDSHRAESPQLAAVAPENNPQSEQSYSSHPLKPHHQKASNLSSAIEQTVRHYLQEQADHSSTTMITPTTTLPSDTTTNPEFYYHVNPTTQLAIQQQADQYLGQQNTIEQPEQNRSVQHLDGPGLLSRLANSSPDLLFRLRGLLRQAAGGGKNSSHYSSENNLSNPMTNRHTELNELDSGHPGLGHHQQSSRRGPFNGADSMLNTFLTSHNLSSHEEIKIPLVLIAMPRILSLKRNHLATSHPGQNNSSISLLEPSIIKQVISPLLTNSSQAESQNNATQLVRPALKSSNETNPEGNYTNNSSTNSGQNVIRYSYLPREQEISMSSVPRHTMAPYARQFAVTAITPTVHQYAQQPHLDSLYHYRYQNPGQAKQHYQDANQTGDYSVASSDENQHKLQQQQQHNQVIRFLHPVLGPMTIDRNNTAGQPIAIPTGAHSSNISPDSLNVQMIRLLEQQVMSQPQEQQSEHLNFVHQMPRQPNQVIYGQLANRDITPHFKNGISQAQIQIVEQQAHPSRSPYKIINPLNEHTLPRKQVVFAEHQEYPLIPSRMDTSLGNLSTSSSVVNEEQRSPYFLRNQFAPDNARLETFKHPPQSALDHISRMNPRSLLPEVNLSGLRPLFHVARQGLNSHHLSNSDLGEQLVSNKLLNRQLLGLSDQRADRRSSAMKWNTENEPQLLQQNSDQPAKAETKKAPKMVVMIV